MFCCLWMAQGWQTKHFQDLPRTVVFSQPSPNIFPRKGLTMKLQWMVREGTLQTEVLKQRSASKRGSQKHFPERMKHGSDWMMLDDLFFGGRTTRFDAHTVCSSCQNLQKRQLSIENWVFLRQQSAAKNGCLPLKIPSCETKAETTCKDIAPKNKHLNCDTFNQNTWIPPKTVSDIRWHSRKKHLL